MKRWREEKVSSFKDILQAEVQLFGECAFSVALKVNSKEFDIFLQKSVKAAVIPVCAGGSYFSHKYVFIAHREWKWIDKVGHHTAIKQKNSNFTSQ